MSKKNPDSRYNLLPDYIPKIADVLSSLEEDKVSSEHSELFHYTNLQALEGMINTGELWATNAFQMNDSSELSIYWDDLLNYMRDEF